MTGEFPVSIVVTVVVDLDEIYPCQGNLKFNEVLPTYDSLSIISTVKGLGTVGCDVRDGVRKSKVLTDSPINGEPNVRRDFDFL